MRAAALVLAILALATTPETQEQEPEGPHCVSRCAAIDKDAGGFKACACDARKGTGCDGQGNRTAENMANCVNRTHCLKGCCHCCPRD